MSRSFDAETCCVEVQPAALNAQAAVKASAISFISQFSDCFVGCGIQFGAFEFPAFFSRFGDDPERVDRLRANKDEDAADNSPSGHRGG
ncbi:hypothetical protein [Sinorhizobium medicae]|uniref:hypothetical protein n=1 Tax=Sinorhizobium medicae TaxID=110321 RepID=UPI001AAE9F4C|nr:hypothetical protein [Sinorhizobium medicae]MBO1962964.1 hypothetical protein [Sinorhizobium medicae]WQP39909.1 hypothetical protein U8C38_06965 [Sinorhizobium medicae]